MSSRDFDPRDRFIRVDALRGLAMVWMTLFHFCFDLNHDGFLRQDFYADVFWTAQRSAIVALFLFCAGLGQAIALAQGQSWARFWRRWWQVAGCALAVTLGSLWMFPRSFIYFGVLHGMAVMLLLARLLAPWGARHRLLVALAGLGLMWAPWAWQASVDAGPLAELFNRLNWLGLITRKPITEDYVPLLPWLGVLLWGFAAGGWALHRRPRWLTGTAGSAAAPLAFLGRWSLSYYMLHQPVLLGLLAGVTWVVR